MEQCVISDSCGGISVQVYPLSESERVNINLCLYSLRCIFRRRFCKRLFLLIVILLGPVCMLLIRNLSEPGSQIYGGVFFFGGVISIFSILIYGVFNEAIWRSKTESDIETLSRVGTTSDLCAQYLERFFGRYVFLRNLFKESGSQYKRIHERKPTQLQLNLG